MKKRGNSFYNIFFVITGEEMMQWEECSCYDASQSDDLGIESMGDDFDFDFNIGKMISFVISTYLSKKIVKPICRLCICLRRTTNNIIFRLCLRPKMSENSNLRTDVNITKK